MTDADQYWARKLQANPMLASKHSKITMNSLALEKELRKAFDAGRKVGIGQGIKLGKLSKMSDAEKNMFDDLFNFGDK